VLGLSAVAACVGEMPGPAVCSAAAPCGPGQQCVLGRCRAGGKPPVSAEARRLEFPVTDLAALCADDCSEPAEALETIRLGGGPSHHRSVLLGFAIRLPPEARVQAALLVLDPVPGCSRGPAELELTLAQVLSPWDSRTVGHSRLPTLGLPKRAAAWAAMPARALRLDVTGFIAPSAEHRKRLFGIALRVSAEGPGAACYSTGLSSGRPPRLEIYLDPEPPKGPTSGDRADAGGSDAGDGGPGSDGGDGGPERES